MANQAARAERLAAQRINAGHDPIQVRDDLAAHYIWAGRPLRDTWTRSLWTMLGVQLRGEA